MHTAFALLLALVAVGCQKAPTAPPPVLAGYEITITGTGCRDLATGKDVEPSHCGEGREQPH